MKLITLTAIVYDDYGTEHEKPIHINADHIVCFENIDNNQSHVTLINDSLHVKQSCSDIMDHIKDAEVI